MAGNQPLSSVATPDPATLDVSRQTASSSERPPATAARRRWWRYAAWGVPITVVVIGGLALGLYIYLLTQIAVGPGDGSPRRPQARLFAWPLRLVDRVNILLMGVDVTLDNRRRVLNVARADTLVLLSVDPYSGRITALSIPRDTRAQIPGVGENKINASYAYGGPRLAIRTVEQLLSVKVHYYVKLGPQSFQQLIDAVGGVEITVEKDLKYTDRWAGYTIDLKAGRQKLTGEQATGYIRFRHDELGDIGRVDRQRKVMNTLVEQFKQPSTVLRAPQLLRAFARNTQTDLSAGELMALGLFGIRAKSAPMQEFTLPGSFAPVYWEPDFARIRPMVADLFYGLSKDELTGTEIEIINGSGTPELGRRAAARLQDVGFRSITVTTAAARAEVTMVISRSAQPNAARLAAAALGRAVLRHVPGTPGPAITVVVARDADGRAQSTMFRRNGSQ